MKISKTGLILLLLLLISIYPTWSQKKILPRTIITTDGEVDDQDSFIRMLLYANEFQILGLIYSSSQWHYTGDGKGTRFISELKMTRDLYGERTELRWPGTHWMQEMIDKYSIVYPNLQKHAESYPSPSNLKSIIRVGNIIFEGDMSSDTEGSDFIKKILLDNSTEPIFLQIWGGTNTVARALKSIEDQYKNTAEWTSVRKKINEKAILYMVLDQDATYKKYIEPNWPDVRVFYNSAQFWNFAYPWPKVVPKELQHYLRGQWFKENIKFNHGPLLSNYYLWGDGTSILNDFDHTHGDTTNLKKNGMTQYDFISEGDSPAFFHLIDVGLDNLENPSYGGWGGRMTISNRSKNRWEDGDEVEDYNPFTNQLDKAFPQTRWIDVLQNDFAARADWCVLPFTEANHPPVVTLNQNNVLKAKPGASVTLSGTVKDPDGDTYSIKWWQYFEVDRYPGKISLRDANKEKVKLSVPPDAKAGEDIHLIFEVTDSGSPKLTRYRRTVIQVE